MTLTAILPTLRRSIPDPLQPRRWPEHTVPTVSDVVIGGVSLRRLVDIAGTPALLTGDLLHPKPAQAHAQGIGNDVTVLVFQVTLRVDTDTDKRVALTDCGFDRVAPYWDECRLIGRTSTAKNTTIELIPDETVLRPSLTSAPYSGDAPFEQRPNPWVADHCRCFLRRRCQSDTASVQARGVGIHRRPWVKQAQLGIGIGPHRDRVDGEPGDCRAWRTGAVSMTRRWHIME